MLTFTFKFMLMFMFFAKVLAFLERDRILIKCLEPLLYIFRLRIHRTKQGCPSLTERSSQDIRPIFIKVHIF